MVSFVNFLRGVTKIDLTFNYAEVALKSSDPLPYTFSLGTGISGTVTGGWAEMNDLDPNTYLYFVRSSNTVYTGITPKFGVDLGAVKDVCMLLQGVTRSISAPYITFGTTSYTQYYIPTSPGANWFTCVACFTARYVAISETSSVTTWPTAHYNYFMAYPLQNAPSLAGAYDTRINEWIFVPATHTSTKTITLKPGMQETLMAFLSSGYTYSIPYITLKT
ncbi:MAG: hypothetical protein QW230_00800 [Thermofilum sp.]